MKFLPTGPAIAALRHRAELRLVSGNPRHLAAAPVLLVACVRNEMPRIPFFLSYYRRLGIAHFLFIDNDSTDGFAQMMRLQEDCSVWRAHGSYKGSNFGMDWCNWLLNRHGVGKWCLTCDPDELLVYPYCRDRSLPELCAYMDEAGQGALFTTMIDTYSDRSIAETELDEETDPFELCPYFDRFNFTQKESPYGGFWVQGGVRMRRMFQHTPGAAPAVNKVPLVKWRRGLYYVSSMHTLNDPALNCTLRGNPLFVSGALMHFKYVNLLTEKAREEQQRRQHYDGSIEYKRYVSAGDAIFHDPAFSVRYEGPETLVAARVMQPGGWF